MGEWVREEQLPVWKSVLSSEMGKWPQMVHLTMSLGCEICHILLLYFLPTSVPSADGSNSYLRPSPPFQSLVVFSLRWDRVASPVYLSLKTHSPLLPCSLSFPLPSADSALSPFPSTNRYQSHSSRLPSILTPSPNIDPNALINTDWRNYTNSTFSFCWNAKNELFPPC